MFATKCPGQDMRYWTADDVHEEKCPKCGETIEFFKTDIRFRCRNCKTKVANPRFDMGCAQWCAHAEMCLGPGAKGLAKKSLKTILENEFSALAGNFPEMVEAVKELLKSAEQRCRESQVDYLPVAATFIIVTLLKMELIKVTDEFLERINREHSMPKDAEETTRSLVDNVIENRIEGDMENIVVDLASKLEENHLKNNL